MSVWTGFVGGKSLFVAPARGCGSEDRGTGDNIGVEEAAEFVPRWWGG